MFIQLGNELENLDVSDRISIYELKRLIQDKKNIPIAEIHILKAEGLYYQNMEVIDGNSRVTIKQIKNRCPVCQTKAAAIIGNCKFCCLNYCAGHRLPETHTCPNLKDCKKQSFEKNSQLVMSQKCVALKI